MPSAGTRLQPPSACKDPLQAQDDTRAKGEKVIQMNLDDFMSFPDYDQAAPFYALEFDELFPEEQLLRIIDTLEAEVKNGGFYQYFHNSGGEHAQRAPEAYGIIGAHAVADIVRRANAEAFGGPTPVDRMKRIGVLDALGKKSIDALEKLDDEFYIYSDYIAQHRRAYCAENQDRIRDAVPRTFEG